MQQPQPGSLSTCVHSAGMAGQPINFSCVQGAQRIGSGPTTGDDLTTAADATVATTSRSFSYNPDISDLQVPMFVFVPQQTARSDYNFSLKGFFPKQQYIYIHTYVHNDLASRHVND